MAIKLTRDRPGNWIPCHIIWDFWEAPPKSHITQADCNTLMWTLTHHITKSSWFQIWVAADLYGPKKDLTVNSPWLYTEGEDERAPLWPQLWKETIPHRLFLPHSASDDSTLLPKPGTDRSLQIPHCWLLMCPISCPNHRCYSLSSSKVLRYSTSVGLFLFPCFFILFSDVKKTKKPGWNHHHISVSLD